MTNGQLLNLGPTRCSYIESVVAQEHKTKNINSYSLFKYVAIAGNVLFILWAQFNHTG